MARVTHAAPHLPIAEVKNRMRTDPRTDWRHGFLIIYNALVEPRSAEEIAMNTPFSFWHRMKGVLAGSVR